MTTYNADIFLIVGMCFCLFATDNQHSRIEENSTKAAINNILP